jgi:hypothetical protein
LKSSLSANVRASDSAKFTSATRAAAEAAMKTLRSPATDNVSVMKESNTASRARPSVMPSRPNGSWARAMALTAITQTNVVITQERITAILSCRL